MKGITDKEFNDFIGWLSEKELGSYNKLLLHLIASVCCCPELIDKIILKIKNEEYEKILNTFENNFKNPEVIV